MDRLHVKCMAQDEGDFLASAEVSEPVPGEGALGGDGDVISIGSDEGEEGNGIWREVSVDHDLPFLVEDAGVEGSGVEIDTTVVVVLSCIESHEASYWLRLTAPA